MEPRICVNCGALVPPEFARMCNKCWQPWDVRSAVAQAAFEEAASSGAEPRICVNCGVVVPPEFERTCNKCWQPWRRDDPILESELERATQHWTLPLVPRTYQDNVADRRRLTLESKILPEHGYEASMQTQEGGHIHVGRLLVTAGWSVLAGQRGIRSKGSLTITYRLQADDQPPMTSSVDPIAQIKRLGDLRDAGLLTAEEFDAKKAELLARM